MMRHQFWVGALPRQQSGTLKMAPVTLCQAPTHWENDSFFPFTSLFFGQNRF